MTSQRQKGQSKSSFATTASDSGQTSRSTGFMGSFFQSLLLQPVPADEAASDQDVEIIADCSSDEDASSSKNKGSTKSAIFKGKLHSKDAEQHPMPYTDVTTRLTTQSFDEEDLGPAGDSSGSENEDECSTEREQEQEQLFGEAKKRINTNIEDGERSGLRRRGGPAHK